MAAKPWAHEDLFRLDGQVAAITGGGGMLCRALGGALAAAGVQVALLDRSGEAAKEAVTAITAQGGRAISLICDVTERAALEATCERIRTEFGRLDILINGAGGNQPRATTSAELSFFDLDPQAVAQVFASNFTGTFMACQAFGRQLARQQQGVILNIASMNSLRPLTRTPAYSAAKAAVANLTQWLAVHMAQEYSPQIRVNAIAPGFFLTAQNRSMLIDAQTGEYTSRGRRILDHTPLNRLGLPEDLFGTVLWLVSPASAFVTGIVVPVDGGFSAYSGV